MNVFNSVRYKIQTHNKTPKLHTFEEIHTDEVCIFFSLHI